MHRLVQAAATQHGAMIIAPGEIEAKLSTGGTTSLQFQYKLLLNQGYTYESDEDLRQVIAVLWPQRARGRAVHDMSDGLSLCDMSAVIQDEVYAIGLLEYGKMNGWWVVTYDENVVCPNMGAGRCFTHCTATITRFSPPRRRPRRKKAVREKRASRFSLPGLFPERGIAIA